MIGEFAQLEENSAIVKLIECILTDPIPNGLTMKQCFLSDFEQDFSYLHPFGHIAFNPAIQIDEDKPFQTPIHRFKTS